MPWNLFILPLIGGYYILSRSNYFKYKQQRLDRQRLLFDSVLASVCLFFGAFIFRKFIELLKLDFGLINLTYSLFPIKIHLFGTALFSLIIAILLTEFSNRLLFKNYKTYIQTAVKEVGNELELLLESSLTNSKILAFTLDTGKYYVVWVKELPIPTITNYIRVVPIFSGYRDTEKEVIFTTHYLSAYSNYIENINLKSLEDLDIDLIITLDNVVSVSYFDIDMYEQLNA